MGDARNYHSISVHNESSHSKNQCMGYHPQFHVPQSYELAISRLNRGGVEVIIASCIFWASPVWSVPPPPEHWHVGFHTPLIPLHQTFHPWSSKEALENISKEHTELPASPNLEEPHLSDTGPVQWTIHTLWHFLSLTPFQSLFL